MALLTTWRAGSERRSVFVRLARINWLFVLLATLIAAIGFALLYSAANGNLEPWALRQMARFGGGFLLMLAIAVVDIRFWLRWAYLIYCGALALLAFVELAGVTGMGATRWLDVGLLQLQPSEMMKIALVLALARYLHGSTSEQIVRWRTFAVPGLLTLLPAGLVFAQPDLGTGIILVLIAATVLFLAGARLWKLGVLAGLGLSAVPLAWQFLKEYQKKRILTFLDPEQDPLGAGYHILQSKIALGSGGVWGKGFLQGSQSQLNFLPEKQTDFIFTMLAEEFGLMGALLLLLLYVGLVVIGLGIALSSASLFGRLVALGIMTMFFLYVFINIAMVMGLVPVVGVPLPLVSYGGSALIALLAGFGFVLNAGVHRDVALPRTALAFR